MKRTVENIAVSPGPNLFSSDENNVFIEGNSHLHLLINNMSGQWMCSELIADTSLGFGTCTFNLKSRVDNLDLHAVTGLFTWDDVAKYSNPMPEDYFREYDIEFISMREDSSVIARFEYTGDHYKYPGRENIRINLWLNFGQAPSGFQEAILSGFEFENLLPAPLNVTAKDGNPMRTTITWKGQPEKLFGIYRGSSDDPMAAQLLTEEWISQSSYMDSLAEKGKTYYYWVRSGENSQGSNRVGHYHCNFQTSTRIMALCR